MATQRDYFRNQGYNAKKPQKQTLASQPTSNEADDLFDLIPGLNKNLDPNIIKRIGHYGTKSLTPIGFVGTLGKTMDKVADPILGGIYELGSNKSLPNALDVVRKRWADEIDYTGKHAISGFTGGYFQPEDLQGKSWGAASLATEIALDPTGQKIWSKSIKDPRFTKFTDALAGIDDIAFSAVKKTSPYPYLFNKYLKDFARVTGSTTGTTAEFFDTVKEKTIYKDIVSEDQMNEAINRLDKFKETVRMDLRNFDRFEDFTPIKEKVDKYGASILEETKLTADQQDRVMQKLKEILDLREEIRMKLTSSQEDIVKNAYRKAEAEKMSEKLGVDVAPILNEEVEASKVLFEYSGMAQDHGIKALIKEQTQAAFRFRELEGRTNAVIEQAKKATMDTKSFKDFKELTLKSTSDVLDSTSLSRLNDKLTEKYSLIINNDPDWAEYLEIAQEQHAQNITKEFDPMIGAYINVGEDFDILKTLEDFRSEYPEKFRDITELESQLKGASDAPMLSDDEIFDLYKAEYQGTKDLELYDDALSYKTQIQEMIDGHTIKNREALKELGLTDMVQPVAFKSPFQQVARSEFSELQYSPESIKYDPAYFTKEVNLEGWQQAGKKGEYDIELITKMIEEAGDDSVITSNISRLLEDGSEKALEELTSLVEDAAQSIHRQAVAESSIRAGSEHIFGELEGLYEGFGDKHNIDAYNFMFDFHRGLDADELARKYPETVSTALSQNWTRSTDNKIASLQKLDQYANMVAKGEGVWANGLQETYLEQVFGWEYKVAASDAIADSWAWLKPYMQNQKKADPAKVDAAMKALSEYREAIIGKDQFASRSFTRYNKAWSKFKKAAMELDPTQTMEYSDLQNILNSVETAYNSTALTINRWKTMTQGFVHNNGINVKHLDDLQKQGVITHTRAIKDLEGKIKVKPETIKKQTDKITLAEEVNNFDTSHIFKSTENVETAVTDILARPNLSGIWDEVINQQFAFDAKFAETQWISPAYELYGKPLETFKQVKNSTMLSQEWLTANYKEPLRNLQKQYGLSNQKTANLHREVVKLMESEQVFEIADNEFINYLANANATLIWDGSNKSINSAMTHNLKLLNELADAKGFGSDWFIVEAHGKGGIRFALNPNKAVDSNTALTVKEFFMDAAKLEGFKGFKRQAAKASLDHLSDADLEYVEKVMNLTRSINRNYSDFLTKVGHADQLNFNVDSYVPRNLDYWSSEELLGSKMPAALDPNVAQVMSQVKGSMGLRGKFGTFEYSRSYIDDIDTVHKMVGGDLFQTYDLEQIYGEMYARGLHRNARASLFRELFLDKSLKVGEWDTVKGKEWGNIMRTHAIDNPDKYSLIVPEYKNGVLQRNITIKPTAENFVKYKGAVVVPNVVSADLNTYLNHAYMKDNNPVYNKVNAFMKYVKQGMLKNFGFITSNIMSMDVATAIENIDSFDKLPKHIQDAATTYKVMKSNEAAKAIYVNMAYQGNMDNLLSVANANEIAELTRLAKTLNDAESVNPILEKIDRIKSTSSKNLNFGLQSISYPELLEFSNYYHKNGSTMFKEAIKDYYKDSPYWPQLRETWLAIEDNFDTVFPDKTVLEEANLWMNFESGPLSASPLKDPSLGKRFRKDYDPKLVYPEGNRAERMAEFIVNDNWYSSKMEDIIENSEKFQRFRAHLAAGREADLLGLPSWAKEVHQAETIKKLHMHHQQMPMNSVIPNMLFGFWSFPIKQAFYWSNVLMGSPMAARQINNAQNYWTEDWAPQFSKSPLGAYQSATSLMANPLKAAESRMNPALKAFVQKTPYTEYSSGKYVEPNSEDYSSYGALMHSANPYESGVQEIAKIIRGQSFTPLPTLLNRKNVKVKGLKNK